MPIRPIQRAAAVAVAFALLLAGCGAGPTASPTVGPSGSASATAGPLGRIDAGRIRTDIEALDAIAAANGWVRTAGTAGYEASVQYVAGQLRDLGYAVQTPEFEMAIFAEYPGASITIGGGGATFGAGADFHAMIYSGSGDITARVVTAGFDEGERGGCDASDFATFPTGAIALTPRDRAFGATWS